MAFEFPYTTAVRVTKLAGQLGVDLRLDDSADADDDMNWAIDTSSAELDFYLSRYSQADCAASEWVMAHATWFAVRVLSQRRLNDVPESIEKEWARREKQLMLVQQRKADAPRLAKSRRPVAVTNYIVDLQRYNGPVRVDQNRSTGVAKGYRRPTDPGSPDAR